MTETIPCPHCGVINQNTAAFCTACGLALPGATLSGPRVVSDAGFAATAAGKSLQTELLKKESTKAAGALLAVAILQVLFGTLLYFIAAGGVVSDVEFEADPIVFITIYGVAVVFFCLYLWARKNPLPAAIVGLVLFVSIHLLDAIVDPTALTRGIIIKIIIVVILIRAIRAGAKHRALSGQVR